MIRCTAIFFALTLPGIADAAELEAGAEFGRRLCSGQPLETERMDYAIRTVGRSGDQRLIVEISEGARPVIHLRYGPDCRLQHARVLAYGEDGPTLTRYGPDLRPIGPAERLNPPMPSKVPQMEEGTVVVALFDSGLAYTLPKVAMRLAADAEGHALGYDFWEMDGRPFDGDTGRSPFFPIRHGTPVASIVLREAPKARIAPFRYPRPDMTRMDEMVDAAAEVGARIVTMPMGSNRRKDWASFIGAAEAHSELLFVLSAGNNGRDLDKMPLRPASSGLDNVLVVTSSDDFGRLSRGSSWGAETVDLMVPAEGIEVFDVHGSPGEGSGTSYAVPRVVALAARILAQEPELTTEELKTRVVARAVPSPYEREKRVRHGWIADPTAVR